MIEGELIDARNKKSRTPLHFSVAKGDEEIVPVPLNTGANVNAIDSHANTSLTLSYRKSQPRIVELFMAHGAEVNYRSSRHGYTNLHSPKLRQTPPLSVSVGS